jgi:hypothetical protein
MRFIYVRTRMAFALCLVQYAALLLVFIPLVPAEAS